MRVLVWYWGRRGAGAQYTLQIVRALNALPGIEVYASVSNANELASETISRAQGGQIIRVHSMLGAATAVLDPRRSIGAYARSIGADVVLHPMISPHTLVSWRTLRGTPIVTVVHDPEPHPGDKRPIADAAWRKALRRSARIVAPSALVGQRLRLLTDRPVDVIPFGPLIDVDDGSAGSAGSAGWDPDGPITFIGRLLAYKGLDLLAEAWSRLEPGRCRLVVVGEGGGSIEPVLAQLVASGAEVRQGWLSEADLVSTLTGSRAMVLPYREASQSGLVPIAHALGIPVLASDTGALPEQIGPGGWIVAATVNDFTAGLKVLIADPREVKRCHDLLKYELGPNWTEVGSDMARTLRTAIDE